MSQHITATASSPIPEVTHYATSHINGVVTEITNQGPMKDHPRLSLWTATVKLRQDRAAVKVTLSTLTREEHTPQPQDFLHALLTDLICDSLPAAA